MPDNKNVFKPSLIQKTLKFHVGTYQIASISWPRWITNKDVAFKKLVANATTLYCADNIAKCCLISGKARQRRSTENIFKEEHIHLVPGFPSSGKDFTVVVVFYAIYPKRVNIDPQWNSIAVPQNALLDAIRLSQDHISSTFGASIKSIEPYNQTTPSSSPVVKEKNNLVIGLSLGCTFVLLFVIIVISCYVWRKKNHGKFIVKRCVTPIEFVDEKDEIELKKTKVPVPARRRASTLKVVDLDGNIS